MPIPRAVARMNRVGLNRLTVRIAPWAPGFGVVTHRGRRSGRSFRTPVNVFPTGDDGGYAIALTYGPESDWVRNVLAAGGCRLETRRRTVSLTAPRLVHDETRRAVPAVPRAILGRLGVFDFLHLDREPERR
jgi:deazaflavin-dependent oxidoreductase (nitroreductase family)